MQDLRDDKQRFIYTIICTLAIGILTHGYCYYNLLYSHDGMLVYQDDDSWMISLGRFMMPLYERIRGRYYPPSVVGVLALIYIAITVCFIIHIFEINNRITILLICAVLTTNATVTLLSAGYIHDLDAYMLSMMLAVLGVWVWDKHRFGFVLTCAAIILSVGLYQAYIQVTVMMFLALTAYRLLRGDKRNAIELFLKQMLIVVLSLVFYYIAAIVVTRRSGVEFHGTGNGLGKVGGYNYIRNLPILTYRMYMDVLGSLVRPLGYNAVIKSVMSVSVLTISLILLVLFIRKNRPDVRNVFFLALFCLLIPAAAGCVFIISQGFYHDLMRNSLYFFYVFAFIVTDKCKGMFSSALPYKTVCVLAGVFIIDNFIYAGNIYLLKDMSYQATMFNMTRVIDRLEQTEGYYPGAPVVFVGDIERSSNNWVRDDYFHTGGSGAHFYTAINYYKLYERYFQKLLGYPIYILPESKSIEMQQLQTVKAMPPFPAKDCIKRIDDIFVIKISETDMGVIE